MTWIANQNEEGANPDEEGDSIANLPDGIKNQIVEYAISAWAMGSAHDVAKSLATYDDIDPNAESSFVVAWEKEIDWVAQNLEDFVLKGIEGL